MTLYTALKLITRVVYKTYTYVCMFIRMYVCMYLPQYLCMYLCMYVGINLNGTLRMVAWSLRKLVDVLIL